MRTRAVKPEFWKDEIVQRLPAITRLIYIGIWQLADDDGYFVWDVNAMRYNLQFWATPEVGRRHITTALNSLADARKVRRLTCGQHGLVRALPKYKSPGRPQIRVHQAHLRDCAKTNRTPLQNNPSHISLHWERGQAGEENTRGESNSSSSSKKSLRSSTTGQPIQVVGTNRTTEGLGKTTVIKSPRSRGKDESLFDKAMPGIRERLER